MRFFALLVGLVLITVSLTGSLSPGVNIDTTTPLSGESASSTPDDIGPDGNYTFPWDPYFDDYISLGELESHLRGIAADHPDLARVIDIAELNDIGGTVDGRPMLGLKITANLDQEPDEDYYTDPDKEDIVIIGNHHAREWMTIMVPLYFAFYLTELYGLPPTDNDHDGQTNEDPIDGIDNDGDGEDDDGDNSTLARFDGIDNDGDGKIDEGIDEDPIEARISHMLDNREYWIIPAMNPDGYAYDRTISEPGDGGGWRKNKQDNDGDGEFDPEYDGIDLNRNYPYEWGHNTQPGAVDEDGNEYTLDDDQPYSDVYHGARDRNDQDGDENFPSPECNPANNCNEDPVDHSDDDGDGYLDEDRDGGFDAPETQAVDGLFKKLDIYYDDTVVEPRLGDYRPENFDRRSNVITSITFHSYSDLVIWPWGYTSDHSPAHPLMVHIGEMMMEHTGYGSWEEAGGYQTSGDYMDWAYGSHGVLPYTIELNRGNQGGFHPQPVYIKPTARLQLGPNMIIGEVADKAKIAKEGSYEDLNITAPRIVHRQPFTKYYENDRYSVGVLIENDTNLVRDSVMLNYRANNGPWHSIPMVADDDEYESYHARIPKIDAPATVDYYFSMMDVRDINIESGYGPHGDFYTYEVDAVIGFGEGWKDALAMGFMMVIMYGAVWGGLYYFVGVAAEADRRKLHPENADLWDD